MKKGLLQFVIVLSISFLVSNVFASIPSHEKNENAQEKKCSFTAEIIAKVYEYQKAGDDNESISAKLKKQYNLNDEECGYVIWMTNDFRSKVGEMSPEETRLSYYKVCVESTVKNLNSFVEESNSLGVWAKKEDLVGAYELVQLPNFVTKRNKVEDPFEKKYQWFIFREDGTFDIVTSDENLGFKSKKELLDAVDTSKKIPGNDPRLMYRFLQDGLFAIYKEETPDMGVIWSVNIIKKGFKTKKGVGFKTGDIILGLDDHGDMIYLKQLRRLK